MDQLSHFEVSFPENARKVQGQMSIFESWGREPLVLELRGTPCIRTREHAIDANAQKRLDVDFADISHCESYASPVIGQIVLTHGLGELDNCQHLAGASAT